MDGRLAPRGDGGPLRRPPPAAAQGASLAVVFEGLLLLFKDTTLLLLVLLHFLRHKRLFPRERRRWRGPPRPPAGSPPPSSPRVPGFPVCPTLVLQMATPRSEFSVSSRVRAPSADSPPPTATRRAVPAASPDSWGPCAWWRWADAHEAHRTTVDGWMEELCVCAVGRDSAVRRDETPPAATAWTDRETITLSDKPGGKRGKPRRHLHVGEKPEGHKGTGQTEPRGHGPQTSAYQRVGVGGCLGSSPTSPSRRRWPQPLSLPRGLHLPSSVSQPPFLSKKHSVRELEDLLKDCFFVKNSQRSDSGFLF